MLGIAASGIPVTVHSFDSRLPLSHRLTMVCLVRFVIPGVAHHVTQRGNGWQQTFFSGQADQLYHNLPREHATAYGKFVIRDAVIPRRCNPESFWPAEC